jgi:5'(3')-deoxyribonucleotidase
MKRLVIAIDCDDVLISTAQNTVNDYNDKFGTSLKLVDFYGGATMATWGTDDYDVAVARVNDYISSDIFAKLKPYPDAIVAIRQLAKNHELHLVTGRSDFLEPVTARMLATYFPNCFQSIEHTNFIIMSTSTAKKRTKGEVCMNLKADILIDDHIAHGENVIAAGLKEMIVFGNYPWNQNNALPKGMVRCVNWDETVREIEEIASR